MSTFDIRNYNSEPDPLWIASPTEEKNWDNVNWKHVDKYVLCLQCKIFEAAELNKTEDMYMVQRELSNSFEAKLLATRRVLQENKGRRTAGIGDKIKITKKERVDFASDLVIDGMATPIRRIYIPKPNGEKRPLGIPSYKDRAKQAIVKLALEPQWEFKFHDESYGFRPGRSPRDAIASIATSLKQQQKFVLDADIRKCFDRINHDFLIEKTETFIEFQDQIRAWLKAGYHDELNEIDIEENELGTPQGGIISPLLCNIALHGIEDVGYQVISNMRWSRSYTITQAKSSYKLVRFADDFVVLHSREDIVLAIKEGIKKFLEPIGLELNEEKTALRHSLVNIGAEKPGFDFVGARFIHKPSKRKSAKLKGKVLGYKLQVLPRQKNVKKHVHKLKDIINMNKSVRQDVLISRLNPVIRGFSNFYRHMQRSKMFNYCDHKITEYLYSWALKRHRGKSKTWVYDKYFNTLYRYNKILKKDTLVKWRFSFTYQNVYQYILRQHSEQSISNYIKIRKGFSPLSPNYINMKQNLYISEFKQKLYERQNANCRVCGLPILAEDPVEVHHLIERGETYRPERDRIALQWLIHTHCHHEIHKPRSKFLAITEEEPDDG